MKHEKINYVEFPSMDLTLTKNFFTRAFNWAFTDYGPDYTAFENEGLDGGFYRSNLNSRTENGAALIVFYSNNLETTLKKVIETGGEIVKDIFEFPGGRRFEFTEPCGNQFGVWSDL